MPVLSPGRSKTYTKNTKGFQYSAGEKRKQKQNAAMVGLHFKLCVPGIERWNQLTQTKCVIIRRLWLICANTV